MPYADVTKRRTYHAGYMQQWRARQARPAPPTLPGATQPEPSGWAREAQRLQAAAVELHAQAHDATTPLAALLTLRSVTALVVEITRVLAPHTTDLPRRVAHTPTRWLSSRCNPKPGPWRRRSTRRSTSGRSLSRPSACYGRWPRSWCI